MATPAEWAQAYARQAGADFKAWDAMQGTDGFRPCHQMLFLQMACEKLCKAYLIDAGTAPPAALQASHAYIAKNLPRVLHEQIITRVRSLKGMAGVLRLTRQLAGEIELLNPAVDRGGQRPDNCEYPWEDNNQVIRSPLDWTFAPSRLLLDPKARTILKLIGSAITKLLP